MIKTTILAAFIIGLFFTISSPVFCGTIWIPWFVNDSEGIAGWEYDTWLVIKNVHETETILIYIQHYDDSNYQEPGGCGIGPITGVLVPGDVKAFYTGNWAGEGFVDDFGGVGLNCGENGDKGSILIYWEGGDGGEKEWIQGYEGIEYYVDNWVMGGTMAVAFVY